MLIKRNDKQNDNGTTSILHVILTEQEAIGQNPELAVKIRDCLLRVALPEDNKFSMMCEKSTLVIGSFSFDQDKLDESVTEAIKEVRLHLDPKTAKTPEAFLGAIPRDLAHKLSMG